MTSKVLVKLPAMPFPQGKKSASDLVTLSGSNDGLPLAKQQTPNPDKTQQLEQNIKFLQEQYQATLSALHQEVETLRQRNRDLQFQLVFSKGASAPPCPPEDTVNGCAKTKVDKEHLEKDLQQRLWCNIIGHPKIFAPNSDNCQKEKSSVATTDVGIQVGDKLNSLQLVKARLEITDAMVKRLRQKSRDQRREIAMLKENGMASGGNAMRGGRSRGDSHNGYHSRNSPTFSTQEHAPGNCECDGRPQKFPPLQTQSYWHRSFEHNGEQHQRNGRTRYEKHEFDGEVNGGTVLPQLRANGVKSEGQSFDQPIYRSRGHHSHHRDAGNRKYRGHMSQKDRRDSEQRYNRPDFRKDQNANIHRRSAERSRAADATLNQ